MTWRLNSLNCARQSIKVALLCSQLIVSLCGRPRIPTVSSQIAPVAILDRAVCENLVVRDGTGPREEILAEIETGPNCSHNSRFVSWLISSAAAILGTRRGYIRRAFARFAGTDERTPDGDDHDLALLRRHMTPPGPPKPRSTGTLARYSITQTDAIGRTKIFSDFPFCPNLGRNLLQTRDLRHQLFSSFILPTWGRPCPIFSTYLTDFCPKARGSARARGDSEGCQCPYSPWPRHKSLSDNGLRESHAEHGPTRPACPESGYCAAAQASDRRMNVLGGIDPHARLLGFIRKRWDRRRGPLAQDCSAPQCRGSPDGRFLVAGAYHDC